ncbi:NitT/TauT family transport system permease protein [Rhodoblastus acidophilus]|uniref:ABC transporter permease n=1 Tax=Rhodoblastus acidophilus TaxID=1074 RepID=UPI002224B3CC|nr:ABC transporter permease [Rhodoblastus acidophilus]MCW2286849.1 NitT/TauT family transport system permease protein [Rhodoblastus acidophilus]MCW2335715.1 NitT/TauT family transport system permease protein [Rhodoblastus acidophilus]
MRLLNKKPNRGQEIVLIALPFLLTAAAYLLFSALRLAENPNDKLLPSPLAMFEAIKTLAFHADPRTGAYIFWDDTFASLHRLFGALGIATAIALVVGVAIGMLPFMRALLDDFVAVVSMAPPLALLPILFIALGLGETAKIALIVIGCAPVMIRDLALRVSELPREQFLKAQTLGASTWLIALRVVLPQMLPRLIDSLRLSLGPAWLFLIAAEAIASDSGLGYRIFLVRRYLAMDVILPYVAWITLLAFLSDAALRFVQARAFPWFAAARAS